LCINRERVDDRDACNVASQRASGSACEPGTTASRYVADNDGVMLLRYLFGFRGNATTSNGVLNQRVRSEKQRSAARGAHRCQPRAQFDVDLGGQTII
jgi:hypothetical protein